MSDLDTTLSLLGRAAKLIAPMIVPGSGALIAVAESLGAAYKGLRAENGGQAPADAEAAHDALFARVKAHAESTLSRLEGG